MKPLDIPPDVAIVSRETLDKLRHYHTLLLKWQEKINLISPNTVADAWERHFIDSAQIEPLVPDGTKTLYDLGSGAGFAGMVLAIMRPELSVTLIESDAKKCAFIQTVSRETGVLVTVQNSRIEAVANDLPPPDMVSARALASLAELFGYCRPWLQRTPEMRLILPKGRQFQSEIDAAKAAGWVFDYAETPSKTEADARILTVTTVRKQA